MKVLHALALVLSLTFMWGLIAVSVALTCGWGWRADDERRPRVWAAFAFGVLFVAGVCAFFARPQGLADVLVLAIAIVPGLMAACAVLSRARRRRMIAATALGVLLATALNLVGPITLPPVFNPDVVTLNGTDYVLSNGPMCMPSERLGPMKVSVSVSQADVRVLGVDGLVKAPKLDQLVPCLLVGVHRDSKVQRVSGRDLTLMDGPAYPSDTLVPVTVVSNVIVQSGATGAWVLASVEDRKVSGLVSRASKLRP